MSAEAWTFLGVVITALVTLAGLYWQHGRRAAPAPPEPVAATDWAREHVASLLTQIESLSDERDELQRERDRLMSTHTDLRVEFERHRAESIAEIAMLRREFERHRELSAERVRALESEVHRLEAENQRLHEEIATLRGAL